jgi:hypothetical protein
MAEFDILIKAINNIKIIGVTEGIIIIIGIIIIFFHQKIKIKALEDYITIWKPSNIENELKSFISLKEQMIAIRYEEKERFNQQKLSEIKEEKYRLNEQYENSSKERSVLEDEKNKIEINFFKLFISFIQLQAIINLLQRVALSNKLLFYYQLWNINKKKYPGSPNIYERFNKLDIIEKSLFELSSTFEKTISSESIYAINLPQKIEKYMENYNELNEDLQNFWDSINPFIERYLRDNGANLES